MINQGDASALKLFRTCNVLNSDRFYDGFSLEQISDVSPCCVLEFYRTLLPEWLMYASSIWLTGKIVVYLFTFGIIDGGITLSWYT